MFGGGHRARRFSLLLLEEGEDYVGDWVATAAWPPAVPGNAAGTPTLAGRLRLASKSLFFEPDDGRVPIARLPLASTTRLEPVPGTDSMAFEVVCTSVTRMKADNADGPYGFDRFEGDRGGGSGGGREAANTPLLPPPAWRFTLPYASLESVLPSAHTYLAASRLPHGDRAAALASLAAERVARAAFDPSRLADYSEAVAWEGAARLAAPLTSQAGRLAITDARLYFQPLDDLDGDKPVRSHAVARVGALAKRRSGLRPVGLEVFFLSEDVGRGGSAGGGGRNAATAPDRAGTWGGPSALLTFSTPAARNAAAAALTRSLGAAAPARAAASAAAFEDPARIAAVTAAWSEGRLSNLDYLLFLNLASGRSFADVTRYPVVPWVLADYSSPTLDLHSPTSYRDLSKPMGALSPARLATFRERMAHMPPSDDARDAPFLYGTHYSCPGYVLFWLVRAAPAHMLRLQGGRFDAPDRLFASVGEAWASASTSPADVKELIPEFYLGDPAFLVNGGGLALGRRQDGRPVGDVALPPWAGHPAADPAAFLRLHRAALESACVSANLHHWVDLVFGFKARGAPAAAADNLFHPLTYEDTLPADIEAAFPDPRDRVALEVQVSEFGQCPRQLFVAPHPRRRACPAWGEERGGSDGESGARAGTAPAALALAVLATASAAVEGGGEGGGRAGGAPPAVPPGGVGPDELAALDVLPVEAVVAEEAPPPVAPAVAQASAPAPAAPAAPLPAAAQPPPPPSSSSRLAGAAPALVGALAGAAVAGGEGLSSTLRGLFGGRRASSAGGGAAGAAATSPTPAVAALASPHPSRPGLLASPHPSRPGPWGPAAAARLASLAPTPPIRIGTLAGGVSGLAAARGLGSDVIVYAVGTAGVLQSCSANAGTRLRCTPLSPAAPLTCLALLPGGGGPGRPANLVALAGGLDGRVHAYQPASGTVLGSWAAHGDAVTAAVIVAGGIGSGSSTPCLATGSWDGTVRLWALDAANLPWAPATTSPPTPLATLPLPPSSPGADRPGVWALAVDVMRSGPSSSASSSRSPRLILAGTDDGGVFGWDARAVPATTTPLFAAPGLVSGGDYIAGLALCPQSGGRGSSGVTTAVAACGDGRLRLLHLSPASPSSLPFVTTAATSPPAGAPFRCVASDGGASVAGTEDGRLLVWDLVAAAAAVAAGEDATNPLLLPALTVAPGHAVTAVTVGTPGSGGKGGAPPALVVVTGDDEGAVSVFRV